MQTIAAPFSFQLTLKSMLRLVSNEGLSVVEQFNMTPAFNNGVPERTNCTVLLVDTPMLLFEAIALDSSMAAFIPLHIVLMGDEQSCSIFWSDTPANIASPTAPARNATIAILHRRITSAIHQLEGEKS